MTRLSRPERPVLELCELIDRIGPFGAGARQPVLGFRDLRIVNARRIGTNHLKFQAEDETGRVECLAWRMADEPLGVAALSGERLHLAGRLKADEWNGRRRVQLEVIDAALVE